MKLVTRILALIATMLPMFAAAQLHESDRIVTDVPFQFVVADKTVPAGRWMLQTAIPTGRLLMLHNVDAKQSLIVPASPNGSQQQASSYALVFHKYGDRYFLSALKVGGGNAVYRMRESKAEAEIRAQNTAAQQEILVASLK